LGGRGESELPENKAKHTSENARDAGKSPAKSLRCGTKNELGGNERTPHPSEPVEKSRILVNGPNRETGTDLGRSVEGKIRKSFAAQEGNPKGEVKRATF